MLRPVSRRRLQGRNSNAPATTHRGLGTRIIRDLLVARSASPAVFARPSELRRLPDVLRATERGGWRRLHAAEQIGLLRLELIRSDKPLIAKFAEALDLTSAAPEGYEPAPGPAVRNKWLTASIVKAPAEVIKRIFAEAPRRDPKHRRTWVALVDGAVHQRKRIKFEAHKRKVKVTIVVDFVYVLGYLWNAAGCLYPNDDQAAARWVHRQATRVLEGRARKVAGIIRRQAINARLDNTRRKPRAACVSSASPRSPRPIWSAELGLRPRQAPREVVA